MPQSNRFTIGSNSRKKTIFRKLRDLDLLITLFQQLQVEMIQEELISLMKTIHSKLFKKEEKELE